jgi:aminoglycoside 3-N-acetyltransferase
MGIESVRNGSGQRRVRPEELTEGFRRLGLREGDSVIMHASLESFGIVDGGAAMVLYRLLGVLGKKGTLLMPAFTSITRHSRTHDNYTKPGCWCEGKESRHVPFIPELQPDKNIGAIAHRLCSWPASRRSRHPAYSFVAVGNHGDEIVRDYGLEDPLMPVKQFLKHDPLMLKIGVDFSSIIPIHIAEEHKTPSKFTRERALTFTSKGQSWVDVLAVGCSAGFQKIEHQLPEVEFKGTKIGMSSAQLCPVKLVVDIAEALLRNDSSALACDNRQCLSCH